MAGSNLHRKYSNEITCPFFGRSVFQHSTSALAVCLCWVILFFFIVFLALPAAAQRVNQSIEDGNEAFRKNDFAAAAKAYSKALQADDANAIAHFNLANALQRTNSPEKAAEHYNDVINHTNDAGLLSKAYYNKALTQLVQKNLPAAIDAFKQSLRLSPNDDNARDNLQKALNEQKQQQQQNQQQQQQNQQQQDSQKQPKKPQQPKMDKQMMEQKFKELQNQEKQLQKELQKQRVNPQEQEKDW